jgi:hypothetical protein
MLYLLGPYVAFYDSRCPGPCTASTPAFPWPRPIDFGTRATVVEVVGEWSYGDLILLGTLSPFEG